MDEETIRLVEKYGLDKEAWRLKEFYEYEPRMQMLNKKVARGESISEHERGELIVYNRRMEEAEFDRINDI